MLVPDEPDITEVERMHDTNAAAWRAMIKVIANSEIDFVAHSEGERTVTLKLNTGKVYRISNIPTNIKVQSLLVALQYLFVKLEAFPMAMEVKEL
jgi:hypothetical protein